MKPLIFLDLDGVIVDFISGLINFYSLPFKHDDIVKWELTEKQLGMTPEACWSDLTDDFWVDLKMYAHAPALLKMLSGYKTCILTAPMRDRASGKQIWIMENLPDFYNNKRYLIGPGKKYCAGPGRVLIDDHDGNIRQFKKAGGIGIVYPQPWNSMAHVKDGNEYVAKQLTKLEV